MTPARCTTLPQDWLRQHPLIGFFALTFGIGWGGILGILAAHDFDLSPLQPVEGGLLFLMMLLGPCLGGLICIAARYGRAGLRALWLSATDWQMPPRQIAVAVSTIPVLFLAILLTFAAVAGPAFAPGFHWALLAVGRVAGGLEEIGWTGYATPRLLARLGPGTAGLALGLIWAVWHLLVDFRYNAAGMGPVWPFEFFVVYLATLTPYRMLLTGVFARTRSLPLAILMHASFTGWLMVLFPATSTLQSLAWQSVFAICLWAVVVTVPARQGQRRPMYQSST